jgi:hypothetical protein
MSGRLNVGLVSLRRRRPIVQSTIHPSFSNAGDLDWDTFDVAVAAIGGPWQAGDRPYAKLIPKMGIVENISQKLAHF